MKDATPAAVTALLTAWSAGDPQAIDELLAVVHRELRALAARELRKERRNHTLQPTALVNEAFLRLVDQRAVQWESRSHFFAVAATTMRRVLVDYARRRRARKRGSEPKTLPLEKLQIAAAPEADLLDLNAALCRLEELDPRLARVVELRVFGGCTAEETAEALRVSLSTVKREWRMAQAWLRGEMGGPST